MEQKRSEEPQRVAGNLKNMAPKQEYLQTTMQKKNGLWLARTPYVYS
jgi:hypothetical protein